MGEFGREPLTIVEIDVDFCANVYGSSPCTAALDANNPAKCFNTRKTCQDTANIDLGTLTLRFAENISGLPKGVTVFPALVSVSDRAGELNLSGLDPRSTALGKRARVSVQFQDFTYHDTLTDKYQSERVSGSAQFSAVGYDPASRGTFFGRLLARNPFFNGKALRVKRGFVGDALADMRTEHYVISEWQGPSAAGRVTVVAKDVLDLARKEKSLAPVPSKGKIAADVAVDGTSLTVTPAGIGAEYSASGRVSVGREVMTFTRVDDVLTLTGRGVDGTEASAHGEGDLAQECLHYDGETVAEVIYDLLTTYASVPTGFIDFADWESSTTTWLAGLGLTVTITRPTGVAELIGEIGQHGVSVWWEPTAQRIKYRPVRPLEPDEAFVDLTDAASFLEGSVDSSVLDELRISSLQFWHGTIDPTDSPTSGRNFRIVEVGVGDGVNYDEERQQEVFSRWLGPDGDSAAAGVIVDRLVSRYQESPIEITGKLDIKDRDAVTLGVLVRITSRVLQDATGATKTRIAQIKHVQQSAGALMFKAETYDVDTRFGFWMTDAVSLPDYDTATDLEKSQGAFWMDDAIGEFPDGTAPYNYF